MNLTVSILPDWDRLAEIADERLDSRHARACGKPLSHPTFRCTGYHDVALWATVNESLVYGGMGPHWYCIEIKSEGPKPVVWSMPRGEMSFSDRLWQAVEMHEAFYTD